MPPEVVPRLRFPGAEDLGNMFQFKRDFNAYFCGARNLDEARALNPSLQTFDAWLARNKGRIPLESKRLEPNPCCSRPSAGASGG